MEDMNGNANSGILFARLDLEDLVSMSVSGIWGAKPEVSGREH